jgi:hypothetical protein
MPHLYQWCTLNVVHDQICFPILFDKLDIARDWNCCVCCDIDHCGSLLTSKTRATLNNLPIPKPNNFAKCQLIKDIILHNFSLKLGGRGLGMLNSVNKEHIF